MDLPLNLSFGAGTNAARPLDLGHGAGSNAAQTLARHLAEAPPADGAFPSGLGASGYIPELLALAASRNSSMDLRSMSAAVVRVLPRDDSLRRYLESTSCAAYREAQFAPIRDAFAEHVVRVLEQACLELLGLRFRRQAGNNDRRRNWRRLYFGFDWCRRRNR